MPILIDKSRSFSFSLRITTCCPLGMCTRMESTCISTNLAILNSSLSYHRVFSYQLGLTRFPWSVFRTSAGLTFECARAGEKTAACPDRRPFAGLPRLFCAAVAHRPRRQDGQRGLWLYVDALARPARASGLR